MANLDAIAAVPGIDVLFVGPSDLSIGLTDGKELDPHSETVEAALDRIVAACRKAGKIAGLYCANAERAVACAKRGMRFLAVGSDSASCAPAPRRSSRPLKGYRADCSASRSSTLPTSASTSVMRHVHHAIAALGEPGRRSARAAAAGRNLAVPAPARSPAAAETTRNPRCAGRPASAA